MIKSISYSLLFFVLAACNHSEEDKDITPVISYKADDYLTEYIEENKTILNFTYDKNHLVSHNFNSANGLKSFRYEYDSSGIPAKIIVKQPTYNYVLYPVFSDSSLIELRMFIDDQFKGKYIFEYDTEGRIIRVSRVSKRSGILAITNMTWEGENIKEYELTLYYVTPPIRYKYEFEYDEAINPYKIVFSDFKYNFIEFLPISKNNWITMVTYNAEYPLTKLTRKNIFAYAGQGYPFVKLESSVDYDGNKGEKYSEYKY